MVVSRRVTATYHRKPVCHPRSTLFGLLQVCNPIRGEAFFVGGPNTELTMTIKRQANGHADAVRCRNAFLVTLGLLAVSLATLPAQGPTWADFFKDTFDEMLRADPAFATATRSVKVGRCTRSRSGRSSACTRIRRADSGSSPARTSARCGW